MKKTLILISLSIVIAHSTFAQNVGINNNSPKSILDVSGSIGYAIASVSSSSTLTSSQATVFATPGITLTLPAAGSAPRRSYTIIYNGTSGGSAVTIQHGASESIISAGASTSNISITEGTIVIQSDGTNWYATIIAAGKTSSAYIQNQTGSAQSAGFNINGAGTIGGLVTASGGLTEVGAVSINASGSAATNIGIGTYSGLITIGNITNNPKIKLPSLGASSVVMTDASSQLISASVVPLANGGTNNSLTAADGALAYSDASKIVLLPAGTSGQILQSTGAGAPQWISPSAITLGQTYNAPVYGTGTTTLSTISTSWTQISGLSSTVTVPSGCTVLVTTYGGIQTSVGGGNKGANCDIAVVVDGTAPSGTSDGGIEPISAVCFSSTIGISSWSMNQTYSLSAGSHTFAIKARMTGNNNANAILSGGTGTNTQGVMTISFIKN